MMVVVTFLPILPILVALGVDLFTPPSKPKYALMIFGIIVLFLFLLLAFRVGHHNIRSNRVAVTQAMIELFSVALDSFKEDIGRYPTTDEGLSALVTLPKTISPTKWRGPYLPKGIPKDPWRHDYAALQKVVGMMQMTSTVGTIRRDGANFLLIETLETRKYKTFMEFSCAGFTQLQLSSCPIDIIVLQKMIGRYVDLI